MEGVMVRRYQKSDAEEVGRLHNLALRSVGAHAGSGPWDDDLMNVEAVYLHDNGDFLVALRDNQIVGMGALRKIDTATAEITRMRVRPEDQRRGIGTVILKQLEDRAQQLGYHKLLLDTTVLQIAAQKLYEKHGYKETGRTERGGFECILYEKEI